MMPKERPMYQMCYERTCRKYGQYVSADHARNWHNAGVRTPNEDDFVNGELKTSVNASW